MRIAFLGLGSIAKRHIRNVYELLSERGDVPQIDIFRHENRKIEEEDINSIVSNEYLSEQLKDSYYDVIFITNPTSQHFETIKKCVPHTDHIFIEKPVFENCHENVQELGLKDRSVYYVACPLRWTSVIQYIKKNLDLSKVFSVRAISSSYLPDWRPGTDYRKTYSAHKNMGGGVAIDLIHEWDYLTYLFDMPDSVLYAGGKFSDLEIDSDDLAIYAGIYKDRIVELHLDYFGRKTVRELTLYMADEVVHADLVQGKINYLRAGNMLDLYEERDEYQKREIRHFLDIIAGKSQNDSTIEHAVEVLKIAKNYKER